MMTRYECNASELGLANIDCCLSSAQGPLYPPAGILALRPYRQRYMYPTSEALSRFGPFVVPAHKFLSSFLVAHHRGSSDIILCFNQASTAGILPISRQ